MLLFLYVAILLCVTGQSWAKEICCPGLPCYSNNPPYNDRPLPECQKDININMILYNRQDPTNGKAITRDIIPSSFKANVMTMFVVHGLDQIRMNPWMSDIKDAFIKLGVYNVILVTWRGGMEHSNYIQCASNTRVVGGEIAFVSNNTINKGKSSKDLMYCVGASLGAHVCGQAGQQGQFRRISGLDPAGPGFENSSVGLNPNCADLVDNIHTNAEIIPKLGAGMVSAIGDIDFYPNGGRSQPGCIINMYGNGLPIVKDFVTCDNKVEICSLKPDLGTVTNPTIVCSHNRAVFLFTESILTPCFLTRFQCADEDKIPDSCTESNDTIQSMGFNADKYPARGIFYLKTKACGPYCCPQN